MTQLLTMQGITKAFFGVPVLKGVDFDLEHGEVHVLLGENGAGKSTLMKILSGAYTLDTGTIALEGETLDLAAWSPKVAEDRGIVTVYQNFHLIPHLSVAENLALDRFTHGRGLIRWREVYAQAAAALQSIEFDIDLRAKVKSLPVSQKQMLEIAIALSKNTRVLIMDEPTAALSRKEVATLFKTLAGLKARGIGIIYISHKLEEVKQIGDRITVLRDGVRTATLPAQDADLQEIISLMIGKEVAGAGQRSAPEAPAGSSGELLRVEGLATRRLAVPASLTVRPGEILGITGLVGAGKTELAHALFGVDRAQAGAIRLDGQPVHVASPRHAVELGIGYLPEDRDADGLCLNMGVKENMSLVSLARLRGLLIGVGAEKRTVTRLVEAIGVKTAGIGQQVKYLSGGNKQKVVFGKWLTARCRLLILDEPTIGIDVGARSEIYTLIRQFVRGDNAGSAAGPNSSPLGLSPTAGLGPNLGATPALGLGTTAPIAAGPTAGSLAAATPETASRAVIFISSDMDEILEVADRILVMSGRAIVAELDPHLTTKQEIMNYALRASQPAIEGNQP